MKSSFLNSEFEYDRRFKCFLYEHLRLCLMKNNIGGKIHFNNAVFKIQTLYNGLILDR
jgi:hypothetical protein